MHEQIAKLRSTPIYIIIFFALVAVLSSQFSSWGMTGIFFAVLGAGLALAGAAFIGAVLKRQTQATLSGRPSVLDHMISPGGYRRRRYAETPQEAARRSVVAPTPNRPIVPPTPAAPTQAVLPQPQTERAERMVDAVMSAAAQQAPMMPQERAVVPVPMAWHPQQLSQDLLRRDQFRKTCMELAPNFNPSHKSIVGRALLCLGQRGSGKSNFAALFVEQLCKLFLPGVIFDYLIDFDTLPQVLPNCRIGGHPGWADARKYAGNYWEVDTSNAEEIGYYVRECGGQLVVEIPSYPTLDYAAKVIVGIIKGMVEWANERDAAKRLPALVVLDEAQQFLPQNSQETEILTTFKKLNEIGRHYGLTPAIFTQRAARINKDVIGGTEIYVLMRQTMVQDLEVCEKLIGKEFVDRRQIASFANGDALVFEGGESFVVHFDLRQSEHKSSQVDPEQAIAHYQTRYVPQTRTIAPAYTNLIDEQEVEYEDEEPETEDLPAQVHPSTPLPAQRGQVEEAKKARLLARGIKAYLEGAHKIPELQIALDISNWDARQLMAKVKVSPEVLAAMDDSEEQEQESGNA
jgi:hypothetical protein